VLLSIVGQLRKMTGELAACVWTAKELGMYMYICKPLLSADSMTAVCTAKGSSSPLGMEAVGSWATVG